MYFQSFVKPDVQGVALQR